MLNTLLAMAFSLLKQQQYFKGGKFKKKKMQNPKSERFPPTKWGHLDLVHHPPGLAFQ